MKRTVFFISDSTGITAQILGRSLLTQFEQIRFQEITIPYVDSVEKAEYVLKRIDEVTAQDGCRPIVFSTLVNSEVDNILQKSNGLILDFFKVFLDPLESELKVPSSHSIGKSHAIDNGSYRRRIDAMNYALGSDDGANIHNFAEAEVILLGVSRCAKTPTCLYLALQFSIFAANYPLTEDDMENSNLRLPHFLEPYREKLFGLTIEPYRLHQIRSERKANSRYASLAQCEKEVKIVEAFFKSQNIPFLNTSTRSIEEISTLIITAKNLKRY